MANGAGIQTLSISNYSGISEAIFKAIAGKSETLTGNNASIFTKVDEAFRNINPKSNLTFGEILAKLSEVLPDLIRTGLGLVKKIAQSIRDFFINENKNNNFKPKMTTTSVTQSAMSYFGVINNPRQGHLMFAEGRPEAWCADTVSFICRDLYGDKLPKDFGTSSVEEMKKWGDKHNIYSETSTMSRTQRNKWILENVKPGDIFVIKRNGGSHVGIVTRVYEEDGVVKFDSAEGNWEKKFNSVTRTADDNTLSGFISMQQFIDLELDVEKWQEDNMKLCTEGLAFNENNLFSAPKIRLNN